MYTGKYDLGLPNGDEGHYQWASGATYNGSFKSGMKHGKGTWKKSSKIVNCNRFIGNYSEDKKHGYGEFFWESGNYYKGNYEADKRHGQGEFKW